MTTEELHDELRKCGFYKVCTGGGCDALVRTITGNDSYLDIGTEIMLTAFEDASVPEIDDRVQITLRLEGSDSEVTWVASPEETLNFAASVSVWPNSSK